MKLTAAFYANPMIVRIQPTASKEHIRQVLQETTLPLVVVVDNQDRYLGAINREEFLTKDIQQDSTEEISWQQLIRPVATLAASVPLEAAKRMLEQSGSNFLLVLDNYRPLGLISSKTLPQPLGKDEAVALPPEQLLRIILERVPGGLIVIDRYSRIRLISRQGAQLFQLEQAEAISRPLEQVVGPWVATNYRDYRTRSQALKVMETGEAVLGEKRALLDGRVLLINYMPLEVNSARGLIMTYEEITQRIQLERQLHEAYREIQTAFDLILPNSKVEYKLKHSQEYTDQPWGLGIKITGIIADGTYNHVINGLKLLSDLRNAGVMDLLGIDKDVLVEAFIFHDIGKVQPELEMGQVVLPTDVFENGRIHASRSADLVQRYYQVSQDAQWLIRYHHHTDPELPVEFPARLYPMLRLIRMADGLSAAITRRGAKVEMSFEGNQWITIHEKNSNESYAGRRRFNLFTGEVSKGDSQRGVSNE